MEAGKSAYDIRADLPISSRQPFLTLIFWSGLQSVGEECVGSGVIRTEAMMEMTAIADMRTVAMKVQDDLMERPHCVREIFL